MTISSQPIEQAYLRHVVKLNEGRGGQPDIFFERAYQNPIDSLALMSRPAREIQIEMAQAVGGTSDQPSRFIGSRNPGGVYSDAAGGRMLGDYEIR